MAIISTLSCKQPKSPCKLKEIKTLFTTVGIHPGYDTGYAHYVLVKEYGRECMDSAGMVKMALKYKDTVCIGNPVNVIMFFNSDEKFIPNETSQDMEEINKNCLVTIIFEKKAKTPHQFVFYDKNGERVYWGSEWKLTSR
ncbi:hypothetical protein [Paraflavitalea sp. CAU 1676]|uniref:hypothetical protein n=1 Tax=Paraflavitalea sp. CAU 1676 TaxID=3032598 RepID=UPI0023DAFD8D|nr:hypothetical protein [Paraflavitalea sp. CAU 1676]MDF2188429.1 hypothetical protein [Paraflavitalea sp. CAU 1676]